MSAPIKARILAEVKSLEKIDLNHTVQVDTTKGALENALILETNLASIQDELTRAEAGQEGLKRTQ